MKKDDPKISIFGTDLTANDWNYKTSERITWGFFLIFAGIIFFLNTFDVLPWTIWREVARYWPFLVILAGLQIALGSNIFARILLAIVAFSFFSLVLLSILRSPFPDFIGSLPNTVQDIVDFMLRRSR